MPRPLEPDLDNASGGKRLVFTRPPTLSRLSGLVVFYVLTGGEQMKAIIIANGQIHDSDFHRSLIAPTDLVICADGGARNALALGLQPQVVIGDLDSLDSDLQAQLEGEGCQVLAHPARKDETDLELALYCAIEHEVDEILILGALGGRIDQTLANVLLLALPELRSVKTRIINGKQEVFLIKNEALIEGQVGDTLSLLSLTEEVAGIYTEGLEYPLENGTLYLGPARGVSNVLTARQVRVQVGQGLLLAVHISQAASVA
jgi:thiamine pyrophosphokinase